jgi:hypothetical protein
MAGVPDSAGIDDKIGRDLSDAVIVSVAAQHGVTGSAASGRTICIFTPYGIVWTSFGETREANH